MKLFALLARVSEKRPWLVVLGVVLITAFMFVGASRLTTEMSQEAMMPKGYESIEAWDAISDEFGGISFETVLVVADDVTVPRVARAMMDITPESLESAGVPEGSVISVESYLEPLKQQAEMTGEPVPTGNIQLGIAIEMFLSSEYAKEQIVGKSILKDEKAALVNIQLKDDLSMNEEKEVANNLEEFIADRFIGTGAEAYVSGFASMQKDSDEFMMSETRILFSAAFLFIMLVLYLTFRRFSDIFLPLLVIIIAIQWIMGMMGWLGIAYTTMSVTIMPLMLGINIAYVIHLLNRYYEERETGNNPFESITISVKTVGVAVFLTAVTTMFGFASFLITDMPQMRDFGIVCMLGIAFSFILSVTLLPAIIVIRDRRKKSEKLDTHLEKMKKRRREARYGVLIDKTLVRSSMAAYHHHWIVTAGLFLVIAFAVFASFNLKTGADINAFFPDSLPSVKAENMTAEYFGGQQQDILLVEGDILKPENLEALLSMEDSIANDPRNSNNGEKYVTRDSIMSIADLVKDSSGDVIPGSEEEVEAVLGELSNQMPLAGFITDDGKSAMVMLHSEMPDTEDELRVITNIYRDSALETAEEAGLTIRATGFTVLISDLMGNMLPTQFKTSALALLLCLAVLIIVFSSFKYGFVTLIVVVCGITVEIIMLYALNWPLDFMTVTISSMLIGLGIDFGIHVTFRFREELRQHDGDLGESIREAVLKVGRSLVAAAFTTCGVFAILGISSAIMMRRFGLTIAIGLLGALVGAVLVLPSLLAIISRKSNGETAPGEESA
ncbi:MAG: hydrophobe/amphiphile efflux-3 (HAE3) family transporter [Actinobacteria bacterium]|nr:hydrophobe/amphiphile efflux-3 (HAE3) family transporter [Actinomycetota bacterium]MCG2820126.1 hydrophobe/amphiphile efflux-3 (HAE3) family transporter [Actinomycetes bacterium]MBU4218069.1 hydrophobe/amphiphile efflux-3 (HAE3) family transporter [Actinomycetota bacterium]MBU4358356.1 hydrophobe/amphiphile efflux-3 (HAE3) family transporter [Actinomycetota bacterium]MBU4391417.1 hydrophobe/amphiphile efflux-3 (HAE3) family transporter [Actinomycetota bacterium]